VLEEDVKKEIFYDKKRMSTAILDDFSLKEAETLERLANSFKADLSEAIHIALSVEDDEYKTNLLKDLQGSVAALRKEVTTNCHLAIISTVMEDYC